MRSATWRTVLTAVFYVVLAVVLAACLVPFVSVLPHSLATRVAHNSEGYVLALILIPWIQFARPRLAGRRAEWPAAVTVAVACVAVGVLLIASDLPSRIRTLNEGFIAAGLLVPYVQLRRPVPRALPVVVAVIGVLVAVVFDHNTEVTDLAEVWGALVLIPLAVDVFDRGILDPDARTSPALRYGWYAALIVVPIGCAVLDFGMHVTGVLYQVVHYVGRCNEDFVAALLLSLALAVIAGRTGRPAGESDAGRQRGAAVATGT
jgi:uncharacterized membrane protein